MPLVRVDHFSRADILRWHQQGAHVAFGDNVDRTGRAGQAREARGCPNAIGIATKWSPRTTPDAYFSDADYDRIVAIVDADFERLRQVLRAGGTVYFPAAGVGTGLSDLPRRAPRVWAFVQASIAQLERIAAAGPATP